MNRIKLLVLALVMVAFAGCRDEDLNPIPVYETSVHGWGRFDAASPKNFVFEDLTKDITTIERRRRKRKISESSMSAAECRCFRL